MVDSTPGEISGRNGDPGGPTTDSPVSAHRPECASRRLAGLQRLPGLLAGTGQDRRGLRQFGERADLSVLCADGAAGRFRRPPARPD